MEYVVYFIAGFILDVLITRLTQAVVDGARTQAALISFAITMLGSLLFIHLVLAPDYFWNVLAYAIGGAAGTWLMVKRK